MKLRQLLIAGTALAVAATGVLAAAPARAQHAAGPAKVKTTITLLHSGKFRVISTGHAPSGATVYLQDRFNKHQVWATERVGKASRRGSFRLVLKTGRGDALYRTCVAQPGKDACTSGRTPRVIKRKGTITLTEAPKVFSPLSEQTIKGTVSPSLREFDVHLEYLDAATKKWRRIDDDHAQLYRPPGLTFEGLGIRGLGVGGLGLQLRVSSDGDTFHAAGHSAPFTADSYRDIDLADLPVVSGSVATDNYVVIQPDFYVSLGSEGMAPGGPGPTNTLTLSLGASCSTIVGGVSNDHGTFQYPTADFTATVALDGTPVFTHDELTDPFEFVLPVTGQQQLTLSATYDPDHYYLRPWFVRNLSPAGSPANYASAVCAR